MQTAEKSVRILKKQTRQRTFVRQSLFFQKVHRQAYQYRLACYFFDKLNHTNLNNTSARSGQFANSLRS